MDTSRVRPATADDTSTILFVASHEAAHATLDLLFGIPIHSVEIRQGMTGFTDDRSATWLKDLKNPLPLWRCAARFALRSAAGLAVELDCPGIDPVQARHAAGFTQRPSVGEAEQLQGALGIMDPTLAASWTLLPETEIQLQLLATVLTKASDLVKDQCGPVFEGLVAGLMRRGFIRAHELDALRNHESLVAVRATLEDGQMEGELREQLRTIVAAGVAAPPP